MVAILACAVYFYYLRIRFRYLEFLFLDLLSSSGILYGDFFGELKRLNEVRKSQAFLKTLVVEFGSDGLNAITRAVAKQIAVGMGRFGMGGKVVGAVVGAYAQEFSRQTISLGNISARYLMYRVARHVLYNKEQEINEYVYNLGR